MPHGSKGGTGPLASFTPEVAQQKQSGCEGGAYLHCVPEVPGTLCHSFPNDLTPKKRRCGAQSKDDYGVPIRKEFRANLKAALLKEKEDITSCYSDKVSPM